MNLIKRHKGLALVGSLTLILIIIMFIIFARMIFPQNDSKYTKGLVKIDSSIAKEIKEEVKELEEVEKITITTKPRIVNITITFKEGTKKDKAKEIAEKTLEKYDEKVIRYYNFSYLLTENIEPKEGEEETKKGFNIAGTKHPDIEKISWTKN